MRTVEELELIARQACAAAGKAGRSVGAFDCPSQMYEHGAVEPPGVRFIPRGDEAPEGAILLLAASPDGHVDFPPGPMVPEAPTGGSPSNESESSVGPQTGPSVSEREGSVPDSPDPKG